MVEVTCPTCKSKSQMVEWPDLLDQSGYTYLPATRYTCDECETAVVLPVLGAKWEPRRLPT